jgi:hypothetical protein
MILLVCVDSDGGMAFGGRRQSRDRVLTQRILRLTEGGVLWVAPGSAGLFGDAPQLRPAADFLARAGAGEFCFAETDDPAPFAERAEKIVRWCWNRRYPSDLKFAAPPAEDGWRLSETTMFAGFSHDKITEEVYLR